MSDQDRSGGGRRHEAQEFGYGRGNGRRGGTHSSREPDDSRTPARVPVDSVDDSGKRARTTDGGGDTRGEEGEIRGARRGQRQRERNDRFDFVQIRTDEDRASSKSKQGTSGTPINLVANFVPLVKQPNWFLYKYDVSFKPEEERTYVKKILLEGQKRSIGGYIFDGSTMYTSHRLAPDPMILYSTRSGSTEKIQLTIKNVGEIPTTDVIHLQFYNIVVRKCLEILQFQEIGRNFYERNAAISMPKHRLELWPGYVTTVRQFENQVMMCVDVIHKVLRLDNCLSIIQGMNKEAAQKELIGCIVMTDHNCKTYRIDDIDWTKSPADTFDMRGNDTTYRDYYKMKNGIEIQEMRQPLLVSRPKKRDTHRGQTGPIYLIPELCQMTGIPDRIRNNFNAMKEFTQHLHQPPDTRFKNVQRFIGRIRGSTEIRKELSTWGLEFGANYTSMTGRTAPKEKIAMKVNNTIDLIESNEKSDWSLAFRNKTMFSVKPMKNWVIIVAERHRHCVDNLIFTMNKVGRGLGFNVPPPVQVLYVVDAKIPGYIGSIDQAMSNHGDTLQMIFVILPGNQLDLYAAVKKRCCIHHGIPSQCFVYKDQLDGGRLMSIATKVVIQMNAKLGGEPWAVSNPLKASRLMIIGFDVYHCGKRKGASVGAIVATTNNDLSKFYSTVSFHDNHTELSENLCTDVTKCLFAYKTVNQGHLPGRIIMYRDGVGDGQLNYVFNTELAQIQTALEGVYTSAGQDQPKFSPDLGQLHL